MIRLYKIRAEHYNKINTVPDGSERVRPNESKTPTHIKIRGGHVHNLKNIDVDIPLNRIVGIAGVSGSGKSSLALGILYAEGSRRYLESLSTYTRRRMTQAEKAQVDEVLYVPAALRCAKGRAFPAYAAHSEQVLNC